MKIDLEISGIKDNSNELDFCLKSYNLKPNF